MTAEEKVIVQEKIRQWAEATKRGDKEEAARLKRELEATGVLCDPTKPKAEK
jgi:creatinine amidohydrolase/Fe(II)-dependent formamide hydrolase-like protein